MTNKEIKDQLHAHLKEMNPYFRINVDPSYGEGGLLRNVPGDPRAFNIIVHPNANRWTTIAHEAGHAKAMNKDMNRTERPWNARTPHTRERLFVADELFANQEAVALLRSLNVPENKIDNYLEDLGQSYKTYQYSLLREGYMGKIPSFLSYIRMVMKFSFTNQSNSAILISEYDRLRPKYENRIMKKDRQYLITLKDAI